MPSQYVCRDDSTQLPFKQVVTIEITDASKALKIAKSKLRSLIAQLAMN